LRAAALAPVATTGVGTIGKGERVLGTFDETPEPFALQGSHGGLAPGRVVGHAIEGGDVVKF